MGALSRWLARFVWAAMLWLMRRPALKRAQRFSYEVWKEPMRSRARASLIRQNRFARRYGLRLLSFAIFLFLASMALTGIFMLSLRLLESGAVTMPER